MLRTGAFKPTSRTSETRYRPATSSTASPTIPSHPTFISATLVIEEKGVPTRLGGLATKLRTALRLSLAGLMNPIDRRVDEDLLGATIC